MIYKASNESKTNCDFWKSIISSLFPLCLEWRRIFQQRNLNFFWLVKIISIFSCLKDLKKKFLHYAFNLNEQIKYSIKENNFLWGHSFFRTHRNKIQKCSHFKWKRRPVFKRVIGKLWHWSNTVTNTD